MHDELHDSWLSKTISKRGRLHPAEENFIENAIQSILAVRAVAQRQDGCRVHVLDVGGNIGWISLVAASVSPHVCVTVVEPFRWHSTLLKASINLNGLGKRVHLVEALVADTPGPDMCMVASPSNGASTMVKAGDDVARCRAQGGVMTPRTTIDQLLAESPFGSAVDVMKMDVEGFEALALAGARQLLAAPRQHGGMEWIGWRIKRQGGVDPVVWLNATFPASRWHRVISNGPSDATEVNTWLDGWQRPGSPFAKGGDLLLTLK